jgi:CheY-like chemotaxis protein
VEDDPDLARVLTTMFHRHGIEAGHAQTGREAVELSCPWSPDLLVLDLRLPDGDGLSVVDSLRQRDRLRLVPLVVYTARDLHAGERERLRLGQTYFLTHAVLRPWSSNDDSWACYTGSFHTQRRRSTVTTSLRLLVAGHGTDRCSVFGLGLTGGADAGV